MNDPFPRLNEFPTEAGDMPDVMLPKMRGASGLMVAQDGDDYSQVQVSLFFGSSPEQGGLIMTMDAAGARELAEHLVMLSGYAEFGLPAREPGSCNG